MSNKYSILLEAKLDEEKSKGNINSQLLEISKDISVQISNVTLGEGALASLKSQIEKELNVEIKNSSSSGTRGGGDSGRGGSSGTPKKSEVYLNASESEAQFLELVNRLESEGLAISKQSVQYKYNEAGEVQRLISATVEYNDQLGQSIRQTYGWIEAEGQVEEEGKKVYEWALKTGKATDDIIKAEKSVVQEIKQQVSSMEQVANAQKQIDVATKTVGSTRIDSGSIQVKELTASIKNYQDVLNQVKSRGPIISAEDNQLMAQAELRLNNANIALKQEVTIQKEISDALIKNNELDKKRNEEIKRQIEDANKLADITEKSLQGKSGKKVKEAEQSIVDLRKATTELSDVQGQNNSVVSQAEEKLKSATKTTENASAAVKAGGKNLQSWGTEIGVAIKRTIEWAGAMTLLYGSLRQVEQGIQYVKDLNKELVNIQLVTGETGDSVARMADGFNKLAGELGSTTKEVAAGSLEWFRQGKTAQETTVLLRDSTMMAKLANLDAAQSTEYMTSIMNGFQLQAEDMMGVLDSLVALDNSYATSVGEIADAMQRSSNSAKQSGISLETLASYITILSATTRKSSESIGESLKTMFARFENIKMGKMDEEGVSINNVEEALKRVNIVLRDTPTSFRSLDDVIGELGAKWGTLNEIEQANLAVQIAG